MMPADSKTVSKHSWPPMSFGDYCVLAIVLVAPLFLGGRHPVGRLVFVVLAITAAFSHVFVMWRYPSRRFTKTGQELLLLAAIAVLTLQLLPISAPILQQVSPAVSKLLPMWTPSGEAAENLGTWNTISLTPQSTQVCFVMLGAYALLFVAVVQHMRDLETIERVLKFVAIGVVFMAAIGLLQFFVGNGKYLWVYEHPFREASGRVKGPFQNQNHFAHFLALGIGPLVWWFQRNLRDGSRKNGSRNRFSNYHGHLTRPPAMGRRLAIGAAFIAVTLAGLLTFSRGGTVAMFVAGVTCVGIYVYRGFLGKRSLIAIAVAALVVSGALMIHGYGPLAKRLSTFQSLEELTQSRQDLWAAMTAAIADYPLLGTGAGSQREIYPTYMEPYHNVEYTHGESGYLQVLLETGFVGFGLLLFGIATSLRWCYRVFKYSTSARMSAAGAAVTAGIVVSIVHSLADFVWYIPACMSVTVILLACACRLSQLVTEPELRQDSNSENEWVFSRQVWGSVGLGLTMASAVMIYTMLPPALASPHWERYLKLSLNSNGKELNDAETRLLLRNMNEHLEQAFARYPLDARINSRLATINVRRFDLEQRRGINPMPLTQIREAAVLSEFPTRKSLKDWLNRAVGENTIYLDRAQRQARQAVELCPLQGECYVQLAQLAFLEGSVATEKKKRYIEQALCVRPYDGAVLVAAGSEAAFEGDFQTMLGFWKRAFHREETVQKNLITAMAGRLAPEFILTAFEPDTTAMGHIFAHYRRVDRDDEARLVARKYVQSLMSDAQAEPDNARAASLWRRARNAFSFLKQMDLAIRCGKTAIQLEPNHFAAHRTLANQLIEAHRYSEARQQITWCLRRKPSDPALTRLQAVTTRQMLENAGQVEFIQDPIIRR